MSMTQYTSVAPKCPSPRSLLWTSAPYMTCPFGCPRGTPDSVPPLPCWCCLVCRTTFSHLHPPIHHLPFLMALPLHHYAASFLKGCFLSLDALLTQSHHNSINPTTLHFSAHRTLPLRSFPWPLLPDLDCPLDPLDRFLESVIVCSGDCMSVRLSE